MQVSAEICAVEACVLRRVSPLGQIEEGGEKHAPPGRLQDKSCFQADKGGAEGLRDHGLHCVREMTRTNAREKRFFETV